MKAVYVDHKQQQFFNVENLALTYYGKKLRWNGLHVENNLVKHLYGIMMWDEIYYDRVPHVFQSSFQFGPLDFYEPDFYLHRKDIIDRKLQRLRLMSNQQIKDYFMKEYEKNKGFHNILVNWDNLKLTPFRMAAIAYCMGGKLLAMFFSKLAEDFKNWSYGMPDLVLWREDKKMIKFVEVKSETDNLSEKQKCWLVNITNEGVECDLCWITDKIEGVDVF
ncbi:hypothetical protein FGO68_gene15788 [Halteria grandinella]|uniref:Fanconi-associated nuclease n=1 Tax=Halteria grandinella TaxID=5974 RepID=A0A8J8T904_HALGN|nr:hypothetical protein FGO68_gene15788 [Halteria grandinella]